MKQGIQVSLRIVFLASILGLSTSHAQKAAGAEEKKNSSGKKALVKVKHTTLYKNSHILVGRGQHTIVPKNSILVLPETLKSRVAAKPSGTFVLWPDFKRSNQDWLWTSEVSLDQAKGITPLPEKKMKDLEKLNRVVVALYRGNPVSVLPAKKKGTGQ